METYIAAMDQGTTSSRAILFNRAGEIVSRAQYPFRQIYPQPGWVEHDPVELWNMEKKALAEAVDAAHIDPKQIAALGITNQRETTVLWERATGQPVYNAIVWQCRRTAAICDRLKADGWSEAVTDKTGLLIDAYFSGTKIKWILDNVPGVRQRAERGELCAGTVDSWLIWNLTAGKVHVTDYSNASRTMLFNIHTLQWDEDLCRALDIPMSLLPQPRPNSEVYGTVAGGIPGLESLAGIPICGSAGDQPAALFGQACYLPGQAKNTYGTGCFTLMNVGGQAVRSRAGLVTSVGWSVGGKLTYALEGSVFNAGSTIQWLRDELGLIRSAPECDRLAESVPTSGGVYVVPAFTGLGAPYWDMYARGTIVGLTRGTTRAHIARAVLDSIAFQVTDLVRAMNDDAPCPLTTLRVDGGASVSDILMQTQADLLRLPVDRPAQVETTAFGAAALAGLAAGVWSGLEELAGLRRSQHVFLPLREEDACAADYRQWRRAVERSRMWIENEL
ncbi:glycerol kinase GlpK [Oscillibacter valericigenes]|uniref:glycerol kinase GlpK n=1 Tax=Oscillibacter valericigenes TaxID=351091 RepID=UPI001F487E1F|nr:glycerol kinase GlpK [Oscillibacter valericigenes]MCF2615929.1 glycerol kinase GlpK [Oscillibacter valericigenes]